MSGSRLIAHAKRLCEQDLSEAQEEAREEQEEVELHVDDLQLPR